MADSHFGKGCWKACRDAYGVEGATPDPGMKAALAASRNMLRAAGFCGGYISADSYYFAGTNKPRSNTGAGIGLGLGGTAVTVNGQKVCK